MKRIRLYLSVILLAGMAWTARVAINDSGRTALIGRVTIDQKPLVGAGVWFVNVKNDDSENAVFGITDNLGHYHTRQRLAPGQYRIFVQDRSDSSADFNPNRQLPAEMAPLGCSLLSVVVPDRDTHLADIQLTRTPERTAEKIDRVAVAR